MTIIPELYIILNMSIGDVIHKYRKENGVTMQRFAELCGRSKGYISMLEKGVNPSSGRAIDPSIGTIARIATVMQISVDDLYRMAEGKNYSEVYYPDAQQVSESIEQYYSTNTIKAYYDGSSFIPVKPVSIKKNQPVAVTILDERALTPEDTARQAARQLKGILSDSGLSSETYADRKHLEKELER